MQALLPPLKELPNEWLDWVGGDFLDFVDSWRCDNHDCVPQLAKHAKLWQQSARKETRFRNFSLR